MATLVREMTPERVRTARMLAMAADFLQIVVFPVFSEGIGSPVNDALDFAVAAAMTYLLGWHWAFLPAFASELIPFWDLIPTWTAAVFLVTRSGGAPAEPDRPPESRPRLPPPASGSVPK